MKTAAAASSWRELPADLLGLVLLRLPCLADRVRLRAVCRPWRDGARQLQRLPPPLPWLALLDGTLVDLDGVPVPCKPILREGVCGYLAVDNLAFLVHDDGRCSLLNPLSGSKIPLPKLVDAVSHAIAESKCYLPTNQTAYVKAILSWPVYTSPDPLDAAKLLEGSAVAISISSLPCSTGGAGIHALDIAFFNGKLYALGHKEGLYVFELDKDEPNASSAFHPSIADDPTQERFYNDKRDLVDRYLVESTGRLLMVRRWASVSPNVPVGYEDRTYSFEVFEADLTSIPGRWKQVNSLDGHAIFLGSECSKSVCASQCADGAQEDCIYFMHRQFDNPSREFWGPSVNPLGDSGVYNMRDGEITPLLPEAVMEQLRSKRQFLTWFFPADA